jgi:membrane protease YdiL (CAAX protease family)
VRVAFASPVGLHARSSRAVRARAGNNPPGPLDGLADGISADKVKAAVESSRAASEDGSEELLEVENVPPMQFLLSSVAFYALMGVGSQVASSFLGVHPDVLDGTRALNLDTASLWTVPLLASLAFAITQADKFEFLGEVRDIFKVGVLPSLAPLGLPGVVALSLGAGVGEEAFFRGFLMPFVDGGLTNLGVPEGVASVGVLAGTSVFFGALHAITPAYFYWATGAGALFGLEYVRDGLGTAMVTHTLYDFLAFGFILIAWPVETKDEETR